MENSRKSATRRFLGLNRYQISVVLVLVGMLFFFSDSSIIKRMKYDAQIKDLKKQIEYYRSQTETDRVKLQELRSDRDNLEKFARENYLMKKEGEDVFVIE